MAKIDQKLYYTTHEIVELLPNYSSRRTLLKALHNNQKAGGKNGFLSAIWEARIRMGKRWLFREEIINEIFKIM